MYYSTLELDLRTHSKFPYSKSSCQLDESGHEKSESVDRYGDSDKTNNPCHRSGGPTMQNSLTIAQAVRSHLPGRNAHHCGCKAIARIPLWMILYA